MKRPTEVISEDLPALFHARSIESLAIRKRTLADLTCKRKVTG